MNTPATIKVLKGISTAVCAARERRLLKPLETLFYIKALWVDRPMPDTHEARQELVKISKRCGRTNTRRIAELVAIGFLRKETDGLHAISWAALAERYNILHQRFYHIKPTEHVQLEYIVKAKVLSEKKQKCELGYKAHLKRDKYRAEIIEQVSGSLHCETVAKHQRDNFLSEGKLFDSDQSYALSLRYTDRRETHLNADLEINYKTGTKIFGYQSRGGYARLKRSLQRMGVITVEKRRTVIARGTNTTLKKRKVRLGFVLFDKELGEAFLIQPDKIDVLPNNAVDARYKQMQAIEKRYKDLQNRHAA